MAFITILKDKRANYNPPKVIVILDRIATHEKKSINCHACNV